MKISSYIEERGLWLFFSCFTWRVLMVSSTLRPMARLLIVECWITPSLSMMNSPRNVIPCQIIHSEVSQLSIQHHKFDLPGCKKTAFKTTTIPYKMHVKLKSSQDRCLRHMFPVLNYQMISIPLHLGEVQDSNPGKWHPHHLSLLKTKIRKRRRMKKKQILKTSTVIPDQESKLHKILKLT